MSTTAADPTRVITDRKIGAAELQIAINARRGTADPAVDPRTGQRQAEASRVGPSRDSGLSPERCGMPGGRTTRDAQSIIGESGVLRQRVVLADRQLSANDGASSAEPRTCAVGR